MKTKKTTIAIFMAALLFASACSKKNTQGQNSNFEEITEQSTTVQTETTTATQETTAAQSDETAKNPQKYTGTFSELAESNITSLKIELDGNTYKAKLNVANNDNLKNVPLGEYTASFAFSDITSDGMGNQKATMTAKGNGKSFDMAIIFYIEDGTVNGVTLKMNNSELELMSGQSVPAE